MGKGAQSVLFRGSEQVPAQSLFPGPEQVPGAEHVSGGQSMFPEGSVHVPGGSEQVPEGSEHVPLARALLTVARLCGNDTRLRHYSRSGQFSLMDEVPQQSEKREKFKKIKYPLHKAGYCDPDKSRGKNESDCVKEHFCSSFNRFRDKSAAGRNN